LEKKGGENARILRLLYYREKALIEITLKTDSGRNPKMTIFFKNLMNILRHNLDNIWQNDACIRPSTFHLAITYLLMCKTAMAMDLYTFTSYFLRRNVNAMTGCQGNAF